jgi:peptidoglycan/xylan/chitin deacetylase (PgdA/CDA1 family)
VHSTSNTMSASKMLYSGALWCSGLAGLSRRTLAARGRFVLTFHGIASVHYLPGPRCVQPSLNVDGLRGILKWLKPRFRFLTPLEFLKAEHSGVLLTFDDGAANNFTNAIPLLEKFEAPAVFFVSTQHVKNCRNWLPAARRLARLGWGAEEAVPRDLAADYFDGMLEQQVAACGRHPLITIGSHTVSHPFLTHCKGDDLRFELMASKDCLERLTRSRVELFAYPTGDYDGRVLEAVRAAGYRAAFAEESRHLGVAQFEIPRIGIYSPDRPYLSAKLSGLYRQPLRGSFGA